MTGLSTVVLSDTNNLYIGWKISFREEKTDYKYLNWYTSSVSEMSRFPFNSINTNEFENDLPKAGNKISAIGIPFWMKNSMGYFFHFLREYLYKFQYSNALFEELKSSEFIATLHHNCPMEIVSIQTFKYWMICHPLPSFPSIRNWICKWQMCQFQYTSLNFRTQNILCVYCIRIYFL